MLFRPYFFWQGDFRLESCYELLRMRQFKTSEHSRRVKGEGKDQDEDRDLVILGAFIIRIGFWSPLYYTYNKEPPK